MPERKMTVTVVQTTVVSVPDVWEIFIVSVCAAENRIDNKFLEVPIDMACGFRTKWL